MSEMPERPSTQPHHELRIGGVVWALVRCDDECPPEHLAPTEGDGD